MLLTAVDPDLLLYEVKEWNEQREDVLRRMRALATHRSMMRQGGAKLAISNGFASHIYSRFPWDITAKNIPELRDLRRFVTDDISKAEFVAEFSDYEDSSLLPHGITCAIVLTSDTYAIWLDLLVAAIHRQDSLGWQMQVATWAIPIERSGVTELTVAFRHGDVVREEHVSLIWDEESWQQAFATQDAWPDLRLCAERYFLGHSGLRNHPTVRQEPFELEYTDAFWKSVERQPDMHRALIRSVAKLIYGVRDPGLGDEQFGNRRRCRVSDFWRVHYRQEGDKIFLEEFGEHDIGIKA